MIRELLAEEKHDSILSVLTARFGPVPLHTEKHLRRIKRAKRLQKLLENSATCGTLEDFHEFLLSS